MATAGFTFLSKDPAKRACERAHLLYTPVWGAATGAVMLTGAAERWGNWELLLFGVAIAAGAWIVPFALAAPEDAGRPLRERYATKILLWVTAYALLGNYFWTYFFFEVLHAHYGFQTTWTANGVPVALYLLTIAYFATYVVLINIGWRVVRDWIRPRRPGAFVPAAVALPFVIAGVENLANANPWMTGLYCFDDLGFALWFGTITYGVYFIPAIPFWVTLGEPREGDGDSFLRSPRPYQVLVAAFACAMAVLCATELMKHHVAPHFTDVRDGHVGLRDYGPGVCLTPPRR